MSKSSIEWTQATWNPITGCTKISPGCKYCYAERLSKRLKAMGVNKYNNEFYLTIHPNLLDLPISWKKPKLIFVNSMSDLFHEQVPFEFLQQVFSVMKEASWHRFQILTKRSEQLLKLNSQIDWPTNVWMGVSVENQDFTFRIDNLINTNAKLKFLSLEPLLGPLPNLELKSIDWVIVGGESGPNARPMLKEWVVEIRNKCEDNDVPFFFKQWGGINKKRAGRELEGQYWNQMPKSLIAS